MRRATTLDKIAVAAILLYAVLQIVSLVWRPIAHLLPLGILAAAAFIYTCVRSMPWIRSRLLWGLRNRLIVTYIFIAVIPVLLLLAMMGIGLYLLYPQIGAHLLVDALQDRIGIITVEADEIVSALVQEIQVGDSPTDPSLLARPRVATLVQAAKAEWPGLRIVLQHQPRFSLTGTFRGLTELRGELRFVSEQRRQSAAGPVAVVISAPVTPSLLDQLTSELGPIQFTVMEPKRANSQGLTVVMDGKLFVAAGRIVSSNRTLPPAENCLDIKVNGAATLQAYPVDTTDTTKYPAPLAVATPVLATFSLRPSTLNRSLFSSVGAIGPILLRIMIVAIVVFLVIEIGALATGIALTRTITRSVGDLYEATQFVGHGDFTHPVRVQQHDQLGALGISFNEMTGSITKLIEEQRERQRLEHEVAIASEVQRQLFPKVLPSLPGLELGAVCSPARVVSGDYYDFIRLGPSAVGIAVADIAGKGIFAALLMASLQAALRSTASLDGNAGTARLVSLLNAHLFKNTSDDRYATLFYATYDAATHSLTYTNAGHLPPLLFVDGCVQQFDQGGTVVGLFENPPFTQVTLRIAPGALLVAFSDGLTEAASPSGEELGTSRIKEEILRLRDLPPQKIAQSLVAMAARWSGTSEQADDVTVVVARMN